MKPAADRLSAEQLAKLDALTKPTLGFPQSMAAFFPAIHNGGTSVNGVQAEPSGFVMLRGARSGYRFPRRSVHAYCKVANVGGSSR